jgi:ParB family transcriptional regulator, chromosome partitioning protein
MNDRKRGLGRGLGALIPSAPDGVAPGAVPASVVGQRAVTTAPPRRPAARVEGDPEGELDGVEREESASADAAAADSRGGVSRVAVSRETATRTRAAQPRTGRPEDAPELGSVAVSRETLPRETAPREAQPVETATQAAEPEGGLGAVPGAYFAELPVDAISPNARQPRDIFNQEEMDELVHSIQEVGLLQPIVVRAVDGGKYELIMGERRWRASQAAGLTVIPAIVRSTDDERMLLDALLENLHRSQLNALEEAAAYDQLLKDFSCTHEVLADRIGRSRSQVSNTLRLLKLPPKVQHRVAAGVLSAGHARALLGLDDALNQQLLAERIIAEGLSVRTVEEIVAMREPQKAPRGVRAGSRVSPALTDLAGRLSDRLDTRVRVDLGSRRGKIVVEFASLEDLDRIIGTLVPGEGVRQNGAGR